MPMIRHRPALVLVAIAAAFLLLPGLARAQEGERLNPIVAVALGYEGRAEGQCWPWVRQVVYEATGKRMGFDYRQGFFEAGAVEVSVRDARPGDVIQIADDRHTGPDADYPGLHTAIILKNHGNGTFDVIDSNSQWDGVVRKRLNYDPGAAAARYPGLSFHIYSFFVDGTQPLVPPSPSPAPVAPADIHVGDYLAVNTPGECLNLRSHTSLAADTRITCLADGTLLKAITEPVVANGRSWVKVSSPAGEGWVATDYVVKRPPPAGATGGGGGTRPAFQFRVFVGGIAGGQ